MLDLYSEIEYTSPPISLNDNRVRRLQRSPTTPNPATGQPYQISLAGAYNQTWGYVLEVIVVGGGGGGGAGRRDRSGGAGAGGGGGGVSYGNFLVKRGNFSGSVTIGQGGSAVASEAAGGNPGGSSVLTINSTAGSMPITSSGGVGGQGGENGQRNGGRGGAGSTQPGLGGSPITSSPPGVLPAAGGRGGNGLDDQSHGPQNAGSNGHQWERDLQYYGGGGGGGGDGGSPPPNGGLGGGGSGQSSGQGSPGLAGFGGGGGGGASWGNNTYNYGGNGGRGVVIIRYYNIDGVLLSIPNGSTVSDGGFWITHVCNSPSPITWVGP